MSKLRPRERLIVAGDAGFSAELEIVVNVEG